MILALIIATAAAAADMTQPGSSDWISGSTLVTILTIICGGGGVMLGRQAGIRRGREEAERRLIEGELKANVPQPMTTEQSAYQAQCKDNAADHTNLFSRVSKLEQTVAALDAKMDATFNSIQRQLDSMNTMLSQLFERICKKR